MTGHPRHRRADDESIKIVEGSIYDHPKYYDLVFGADVAAESKFIAAAFDRYAKCRRKAIGDRRLFEPACGTGRLLWRLHQAGESVRGLDLNASAVEFCNDRFLRRGLDPVAFVADMSDFHLRPPSELSFNTINSFRHLLSAESAAGHLRSMANATTKGGLYLLGVHLTPTQVDGSDGESWSARRGHLAVNTHMWCLDRNRRTRIERFAIDFDVHTPKGSFRIRDVLVLRSYTCDQMQSLIDDVPQWELVATHDFAYHIDEIADVDATTEDVVYVLRKR